MLGPSDRDNGVEGKMGGAIPCMILSSLCSEGCLGLRAALVLTLNPKLDPL